MKENKPLFVADLNNPDDIEKLKEIFCKEALDEAMEKPKGKELAPKEKRYNKKLRKERVIVEHTISRMKKYRIMGEEFRNRLTRYDNMTSIVCGLVNFTVINH